MLGDFISGFTSLVMIFLRFSPMNAENIPRNLNTFCNNRQNSDFYMNETSYMLGSFMSVFYKPSDSFPEVLPYERREYP